jgi:pyruvate dehydrogenase E2 component (dihydrolipoamide acetyltransferase)
MDVPATAAGKVQDVRVKVGDTVSEGTVVVVVGGDGAGPLTTPPSLVDQQEPEPGTTPAAPAPAPAPAAQAPSAPPAAAPAPAPAPAPAGAIADFTGAHAGPSVRRLARELGLDLNGIKGTGEKGRITKDDLLATVRGPAQPAPAAAPAGAGIPEVPAQDFSRFGQVETVPLPRIKKISGPFLHRSWLNVPHVTHNDEADITELDAYRKELDTAAKAEGYRVTLLAFLMKAAVSALRQFPEVNSSLSPEKDSLILKSYYHIGIAVDTPDGLVVPVIRDVDRKGVTALSKELGEVSKRARDGKLSPSDMSGGSFTISSLGGIGGTSFTPIVNSPEVAILGVVRSRMTPVWNGSEFVPRMLLPLSLSYDHRVIDGALAARFTRTLATVLEDVRRLLL